MVAREREALRRLVDRLPDDQVEPALRLLERLEAGADPLVRLLDEAPEDDEELTPEEEAKLKEGEEAWRRGDVVALDDLSRELGL